MARKKRTSTRSRKANTTSKRGRSLWSLLTSLALLLVAWFLVQQGYVSPDDVAVLLGQQESDSSPSRAAQSSAPVVSDGALEVVFTTPALVYPDVPEQRSPPPLEQALLADIDAASSSIDVALFEYNLESLAAALVRAHERGVAVRLALDQENLEDPEDAAWAGEIEQAGIPIAWQETTAFLHSKFLIIDDQLVWTGSWNATFNGTYRNNNNMLRVEVPEIVANYAAEFGQMFEGQFGSQKESLAPYPVVTLDDMLIETYFSPQDGIEPHILERLNAASESIRFLAFSYTSDPIAEAMIARHNAGVEVQGVFERRSAGGIGAEFDRLRDNGIAVLEDGNCYTMHHKVIIIDEATVITGSYNFTRRAEETNDENLLIIDSPELAAHYLQEFDRVYGQAQNPTACGS